MVNMLSMVVGKKIGKKRKEMIFEVKLKSI